MTTSSAFPNIVSSTNVKNVQNANLKYGENFSSVQKIMSDAVEEGVFPGAVLNIAFRGTILFEQGFGNRTNLPTSAPSVPMNPNFVFDVGELTGSLITTTLVLRLISQGYLSLADQVLRFIQGFGIQGKQSIRIPTQLDCHLQQIHFNQLLKAIKGLELASSQALEPKKKLSKICVD
jgi:CubicO group peptidase (beta-lactamase class C family)